MYPNFTLRALKKLETNFFRCKNLRGKVEIDQVLHALNRKFSLNKKKIIITYFFLNLLLTVMNENPIAQIATVLNMTVSSNS